MRRLEADTIFRFVCLHIPPQLRHTTTETIEHDVLQTRKRWPSSPPSRDVVTGNGILACSSAAESHTCIVSTTLTYGLRPYSSQLSLFLLRSPPVLLRDRLPGCLLFLRQEIPLIGGKLGERHLATLQVAEPLCTQSTSDKRTSTVRHTRAEGRRSQIGRRSKHFWDVEHDLRAACELKTCQ
jgi:hypothetical protein